VTTVERLRNEEERFNPEMLLLARQARGVSQKELAELLSVTPGWLSKVEGGIKNITPIQLSRITEILNYPRDFFTNSKRTYGPGISELFHRKRRNVPLKTLDSNQAQMEIRRMNLLDMINGLDIGDVEMPTYDLEEFYGNVQDIARAVRAFWKLPSGPIYNVTGAIEEARGIIIPFDFRTNRIDATSCWPPNMPPLIFANLNTPGDRLRFSLCHELGHLVMHQDVPNPNMEEQANDFAAEFLMPERDIRPYFTEVSVEKLATLKSFWKVSMSALLKRAKDIGEITPRHAKTIWIQMGKYGYRTREPIEFNIPVEKPNLYEQVIGVYSNEMDYNLKDLAKLFRLHQHEICEMYFGAKLGLQDKEVRAAIEEAERIIRNYR